MAFSRKDMTAYVISRSIKDPNDVRILHKVPDNDLRRFKIVHKGVINTSILASISSKIPDEQREDRIISVACIANEAYKVSIKAEELPVDSEVQDFKEEVEEESTPPKVTDIDVPVPEESIEIETSKQADLSEDDDWNLPDFEDGEMEL